MWTAERNRNLHSGEPTAELGTVTLGGDPAGVSLGGERRWIGVYGPGGYSWGPTAGVLVTGGDSFVFLGQNRLELKGNLYLNGQTLWDVVRDIVIALLG